MSNPKTGAINAYASREEAYAAWANIAGNDELIVYEVRINLTTDIDFKRLPVAFVILKELP